MNLKWDTRFLRLAKHYADWSKDPSRKVGAVIAKDKHQISQGYNGFPAGVEDAVERLQDREQKLKFVVHAECNAIYNAQGKDLRGSTLYTTLYPCCECSKAIASVGIKRLVYADQLEDRPGANFNVEASATILREAGIEVQQIKGIE